MELLLSLIYLFLEIIGIGMVLCIFFHTQLVKKPRRYFAGGVLLIVLECIFFYTGSDMEGVFGIYCLGWILPFFYVEKFKPKKILYFYIAYNGFSIISVIFAYMWSFLLERKYTELIQITTYQILIDITVIILLTLYAYLTCKKSKEEIELSLGQSLALFIGLWCFCLLTGFAQMLESEHAYTIRVGQYAGVMLSIIAVLFIVLSIWQQIVWKRAQEYRLQNKMYEAYLGMQEEHIKDVIQGDDKMRRFRHDLHAHMTAIHALLQENQIEELKKYVERMQEMQEEWEALRFTGVYAVDAVVREAYQKALEKSITWEWDGTMCLEETAEIYDMCVIFSNLLNNAIEACERLEARGAIRVKIKKNQDGNYICISNTCQEGTKLEDLKGTSKADNRYHGLGIRNVAEIVEKKNGTIKYEIEAGWLHAKIQV